MRLPPPAQPGTPQAEQTIMFIDRLQQEASQAPNRENWELNAPRWMDLYVGNQFASGIRIIQNEDGSEREIVDERIKALVRITYNRIQNACLSGVAAQTSDAPQPKFKPRQTGMPSEFYLNARIQHPVIQQLAAQLGSGTAQSDNDLGQHMMVYGAEHPSTVQLAAQVGFTLPLPQEMAQQLKAQIEAGKTIAAQAQMAGQPVPPGMIPEDALIEVSDESAIECRQNVFDEIWEEAGGLYAYMESVTNKTVLGLQPLLIDFDAACVDQGDCPLTLTNFNAKQVFFDPMTSSYRKPQYMIYLEPLGVEEAVQKYPEMEAEIKARAKEGKLVRRNQFGMADLGPLWDMNWQRDMVSIRTTWIANWQYPMDPDSALSSGKVVMGQVPDESAIQSNGAGLTDQSNGQAVPQPDQSSTASGHDAVGATSDPANEPSGDGGESGSGAPPEPAPVPMRSAFFHPESGEEITPDHPTWPMRYAIREVRDIEGAQVYDRECLLPSFPIKINVNIPIPYSPYGQGEPARLDGLQMALNRCISDAITMLRYNAYPPEVRDKAVADALGQQLKRARTEPNKAINVPLNIRQSLPNGDLKNISVYLDTPEMPTDLWKLIEFLVGAIDKEAGNTDVMQGDAPSGTSGQWVANLQMAAHAVSGFKSQLTEKWLKEVADTIGYCISYLMTPKQWARYCPSYELPVLEAFYRRNREADGGVMVEINSGSGMAKQAKAQAIVNAKIGKLEGISTPTILEQLDLEPDDEIAKQASWTAKVQQSGAFTQPAAQGQPGQPEQEQEQPQGAEA